MVKTGFWFLGRELPHPLYVEGRRVGCAGVHQGTLHHDAHRCLVPALRAGVLRGHEGVPPGEREGRDLPSRREREAHVPHRRALRDAATRDRYPTRCSPKSSITSSFFLNIMVLKSGRMAVFIPLSSLVILTVSDTETSFSFIFGKRATAFSNSVKSLML